MTRSAGILLPIFSLPSPYGVGSMGKEARAFADFLYAAGQKWWQVLPVGPTGAGDSPYSSESTFGGNLLFIDLEALAAEGLLTKEELESAKLPSEDRIDYDALRSTREPLLRKAFKRLTGAQAEAVREFSAKTPWVREYALYRAVKSHFGGAAWYEWRKRICVDTMRSHWHAGGSCWQRKWPSRPPFSIGSSPSGRS